MSEQIVPAANFPRALVLVAPAILGVLVEAGAGQGSFDIRELAEYRLTAPVLARFEEASRLIVVVTQGDSRFAGSPLFTREIALAGDAPAMAAELDARLGTDAALVGALRTAKLTAREYTTFALALIGAHLAHGFVEAGILRAVPAGVAADNVAFVGAHREQIAAILTSLGVGGPVDPH